ncbi:MAG: AmmeMemoRadiSam system radical SAM enzyme [Tissierella sp.]|uniref:AmmeMemoRadiSam system radical SAM enzyme n=1 Tax=Tissierella sp. TaxID=41274 RepID=UPI003F97E2E2
MKEAMHYDKLDKSYVKCNLCPHYCVIKDGDFGICRVRKNNGGSLYSLNYGKISSYGYDPIEKKPLFHFYPSSTIFSIGSFGCNLSCDFCQNYEMVYDSAYAKDIKYDEIIDLASENDSIGIAFTYNEPSIWYEYILDIAKQTHEIGLKNIMVTNGYINEEPLRELLPYIDAMNIDLKAINNSFYRDVCGGSLDPVLKTIEIANSKGVHIEVTSLLIEGANSENEEMKTLGRKISTIDKSIPLHLNRYFPAYKMNLPATSLEMLTQSSEILKEYLDYVYIGNVRGIDKNTYCPSCDVKLIDRNIVTRLAEIKNGKCIKCGRGVNIKY